MKKSKIIKSAISSFLATSVLFVSAITANATTVSHYIDNDDAQGYKTQRNGFSTYLSSGYLGDSRMQSSSDSTKYYRWYFPFFSTANTVKWTFNVYLANASFTDPYAEYRIHGGENMYIDFAKIIVNQNTAANGWNHYYGTRYNNIKGATLAPNYVTLYPSGTSSRNTGADGIYVKFIY